LALGAVGTTLLMARFLHVLAQTKSDANRSGLWPPWLGLLAASFILGLTPGALPLPGDVEVVASDSAAWWSSLWPPALGMAAAAGVLRLQRREAIRRHPWLRLPPIPPGDILWLFIRAGRAIRHALPRSPAAIVRRLRLDAMARRNRIGDAAFGVLARAERALASWPTVGSGVLIAVLVIFLMLAGG
ncbi:MAG: hypothetical protein ACXW3T_14920, partial [Rhodoplanes sp.]